MSSNRPNGAEHASALGNSASIIARDYSRAGVVGMILWCIVGVVVMCWGQAVVDTVGLAISVAQAITLLVIDRRGFYTGAGLFQVAGWSGAKRTLLAIVEVPGFFIMLIIYVIRLGMRAFAQLPEADAE